MTDKIQPSNKIQQNPLVDRLVAFGLSGAEAQIYVYLLEKGTASGGSKIAQATGLHRQYVYLAIPRLIELGLMEEVPHGKQNRYVARAPIEIEKIGRKRSLAAGELARDLNSISNIGNEQDFEVIQGKRAIQQYEMDYTNRSQDGDEEFIIGGASSGFTAIMDDTLEEYLSEKRRKNLHVKYIGGPSEVGLYKRYIGVYQNQEYRFIEKLPEGVTHTVIRKDTVSIFSFLNPPLVYVVKSEEVADNYKQFFSMLWEMAGDLPELKK